MEIKEKLLERFLRYIKIDTQSNEDNDTCPSTEGQKVLANILKNELIQMGLSQVEVDENGYLYAYIPPTKSVDAPAIGFIAHLDTAPDMSGRDIKPQIHKNYDGSTIILNEKLNIILDPKDYPHLLNHIGKTLITTDGTTLLGADDKAGVSEIMTAVEYLINNLDISHGPIYIAFTPDEEIGRGVDKFNLEKFPVKFAYTMDGGSEGELEYETFNAASAKIFVQGNNIHPGEAKNKMLNAINLAMEFHNMLPPQQRPEHTEGYEGFYHLMQFNGSVENASLSYIIRDHNRDKFQARKKYIEQVTDFLNTKYPSKPFRLEMKDQYYNMREIIEQHFEVVEVAKQAMETLDIEPKIVPIRGGTDGARLSFMGIPCPNIFAGGLNFHGKYEYVAIETMEKATQVILKIIELVKK
ncbi:MAG TPA: peptidase T [Bacteroidales bacterium]|nr:peptidase T [Bacteroidales bacterium]